MLHMLNSEGSGERCGAGERAGDKEWGQKVAYVRDINGIVVRMGSYVQASK